MVIVIIIIQFIGFPLYASQNIAYTSYDTIVFQNDILRHSWGATPDQFPALLFYELTPHFNNSRTMESAKQAAKQIEASGKVPFGGCQRWQTTFVQSQKKLNFKDPPDWANEDFVNKKAFLAWVEWITARPELLDVARDGKTMPKKYRKFNGSWGHISPLIVLDKKDCPPGMESATYGDWFAYKWGKTTALSGAYGIGLSDFTDSHPHECLYDHDFNPRIMALFEKYLNKKIEGETIEKRATIINKEYFNEWVDFWCIGYGKFYGALAREIEKNTNKPPLVIDQSEGSPAYRRLRATDPIIILKHIPLQNILWIFDTHTMAKERTGHAMSISLGTAVLAAAREPNARIGANLHSDDRRFWNGVKKHWTFLSPKLKKEKGLKALKRLWLTNGWAHIATHKGMVRRALAFYSRSYWDSGKIDPKIIELLNNHKPTKPFGLALYYSVKIERQIEKMAGKSGKGKGYCYYKTTFDKLVNKQMVPFNYYVSDAALFELDPAMRPAAWIVPDRYHGSFNRDLLSKAEENKLEALAPIVGTPREIRKLDMPLAFSKGFTGFAFYDQNDALIVIAANTTSLNKSLTVTLKGLPKGNYRLTDLFSNKHKPFIVNTSKVKICQRVERWETRVFALRKI